MSSIRCAPWRIACLFAFCLVLSGTASASCDVVAPFPVTANSPIKLELGPQRFTLHCDVKQVSVLHFPMDIVSTASLNDQQGQPFSSMRGARKAFVLPVGNYSAYLNVTATRARYLTPQVDTASAAQFKNSVHLITMSLFTGFCLALAIYVGVLGRSVNNRGFYAYSAYISSAATFFLLQEGLLNAVLPYSVVLNSINMKLFFAGLTVFTAQRFIDRLLDFSSLLRPWLRQSLNVSAAMVLLLAVAHVLTPLPLSSLISQAMGMLSLAIIAGIMAATLFAIRHRVPSAKLVFLALGIMFVAMVLRVQLQELSPFLHRYALIFAVAIEALLLAVAAAEKVKRLEEDRNSAFRRASMDPLCPVLNRRGWEAAAHALLDTHRLEGGYISLAFIDLDKFKEINDTFGHSAGDHTLQIVARILNHLCREQDIIGRYGGDEFVVMSHCYSARQAQRLLDRITLRFSAITLQVNEHSIALSASVGGLVINTPQHDLEALLHNADMQMYGNKRKRSLLQQEVNV